MDPAHHVQRQLGAAGLDLVSPTEKEFLDSRKGTEPLGWKDNTQGTKIWSSLIWPPGSWLLLLDSRMWEQRKNTISHEHRACRGMDEQAAHSAEQWHCPDMAFPEELN